MLDYEDDVTARATQNLRRNSLPGIHKVVESRPVEIAAAGIEIYDDGFKLLRLEPFLLLWYSFSSWWWCPIKTFFVEMFTFVEIWARICSIPM